MKSLNLIPDKRRFFASRMLGQFFSVAVLLQCFSTTCAMTSAHAGVLSHSPPAHNTASVADNVAKTKAILIVGCVNDARLHDFSALRELARSELNAAVVLINPTLPDEARKCVDGNIALTPDGNATYENKILHYIVEQNYQILGVLPISDPAISLAASLSEHLGLPGANLHRVRAGLDKHFFRQLEGVHASPPDGYHPIKHAVVHDLKALSAVYSSYGNVAFIKPIRGGASRGCLRLDPTTDLGKAWEEVKIYAKDGLQVEELIDGATEVSVDQVNGALWVTAKENTTGNYRTEYQMIVPAKMPADQLKKVEAAGRFMSELTGTNGGASHNEVFLFDGGKRTAAVEPNLRPGGSLIWDMARRAFKDFNPWSEWLGWASGTRPKHSGALVRTHYVGIRYLSAPSDGVFVSPGSLDIKKLAHHDNVTFLDHEWTALPGRTVHAIARDNSDYVGHFRMQSESYEDLVLALAAADARIAEALRGYRSKPDIQALAGE